MSVRTTALTPPTIAKEYGVSPDKVLGWIRSGDLAAVNVATSSSGRPRFVVKVEALEDFERRRSSTPSPQPTRSRKRNAGQVIEFF